MKGGGEGDLFRKSLGNSQSSSQKGSNYILVFHVELCYRKCSTISAIMAAVPVMAP